MASVYVWSRRWLEAERALAETDDEEIAALDAHRQRMNTTLEVTAASDREISIELSLADIKQIAGDHVLSKAYVMTSKSGVDEVSNWDEVHGMNDRGKLMAPPRWRNESVRGAARPARDLPGR